MVFLDNPQGKRGEAENLEKARKPKQQGRRFLKIIFCWETMSNLQVARIEHRASDSRVAHTLPHWAVFVLSHYTHEAFS